MMEEKEWISSDMSNRKGDWVNLYRLFACLSWIFICMYIYTSRSILDWGLLTVGMGPWAVALDGYTLDTLAGIGTLFEMLLIQTKGQLYIASIEI